VLGTDTGIVEAGGNRVSRLYLTMAVLQEIVFISVQNSHVAGADSRGVPAAGYALPAASTPISFTCLRLRKG